MSDLPVFDLHVEGRVVYPPEAFDPKSPIGRAYAEQQATAQAASLAVTALTAAEQERLALRHFVDTAQISVDMKRFGEARDRAELLERNLPRLRETQETTERARALAHELFGSTYGSYASHTALYNRMIAAGLDWGENPGQYFSGWVHDLRTLPVRCDAAEAQLKGRFHE